MLAMSSGMPTFVWFGSLATVPPRAVIERCQSLAVSARAELRSGDRRARIDIVGGEVASVDGADPKVVAGWTDGSFRVTQSLPAARAASTMRAKRSISSFGAVRPFGCVSAFATLQIADATRTPHGSATASRRWNSSSATSRGSSACDG